MAVFVPYYGVKQYLGEAGIDFTNHDFKAMLTDSAPNVSTHRLKADVTEIAAGNGYAAGGVLMTSVLWTETSPGSGIWRWDMADFSWIGSGGNIAQFRYVVWYDDTTASPLKPLIGYFDYGAEITITNGTTFLVEPGASGAMELS